MSLQRLPARLQERITKAVATQSHAAAHSERPYGAPCLTQVVVEELPGAGPAGASGRLFYVEGKGIERFAQMTNWDYYEVRGLLWVGLHERGLEGGWEARGCGL